MRRLPNVNWLPAGYGFALVKRGGVRPDNKPNTRMAYLVRRTDDGYRAYIGTGHLDGWTKHLQPVARDDIVKRWKTVVPSLAAIKNARAKIAPEAA